MMNFDLRDKEVVIFDLDGTLAVSKSPIDEEMSELLRRLLERRKVIVVSGGNLKQFETQVVNHLNLSSDLLRNFFIMPGSGSSMYQFIDGKEQVIYSNPLTEEEKKMIYSAFDYALDKSALDLPPASGDRIEDREVQVTFSALGQKASVAEKESWDPYHEKRKLLVSSLKEKLPDFEIGIGGMTSIDITRKGINKAYGIKRASEELGVSIEKMLYVGDALFEGGNDAPAKETGIDFVQVKDAEETKRLLREVVPML